MENNKSQQFKQRKLYNNLKGYDIGKTPASMGYQRNPQSVNVNNFTYNPGEDVAPQIGAEKRANWATWGASGAGLYSTVKQGIDLAKSYNSWSNMADAATKAIGKPVTKEAIQYFSEYGPQNLSWAADAAGEGAGEITKEQAQAALNAAGKHGLSAAQKAVGGAAAAYSLYDLGDTFYKHYNNNRSSGEILAGSGRATQTNEGVEYTNYTGFDTNAERKLEHTQNIGGGINLAMKGAQAGLALGSFFPGAGNLIGPILGTAFGTALGLVTGGHRHRELERAMDRASWRMNAENLMAESKAGTQGLQNKFNWSHLYGADKGKDAGNMRTINNNIFGTTWTPNGPQFGPINSLVGKGESIVDYTKGEASYVDRGTKGKDTVPSVAKEGDNITIAGNDIDITTGKSFADQVAPYTKMVEQANNIISNINRKGSKATQEVQEREANKIKERALSMMKPITDRQKAQHEALQYNCGKHGYDEGKSVFARNNSLLPFAIQMLGPIDQWRYYKGNRPFADNSYVPNAVGRQALDQLATLRHDPTNELNAASDANRAAIYAINQSGAYSPGQRMAMLTAQNTNNAKTQAAIRAQSQQLNNQYAAQYANALMQYGENEARRQQSALATQQENYRQAVARRRKGIETSYVNAANIMNSALQNRFKLLMADETLKRYDQALTAEQQRLLNQYNTQSGMSFWDRFHNLPTITMDQLKPRPKKK